MEEVLLFLMTYVFVFLIYQLFVISKSKRKNSKKMPVEVNYLISVYKIDIDKINYKKLLLLISLVSSLDISIIVTLVLVFNSYFVKLIVSLLITIPIIILSYHLVGNYYKKKGMIKND